MKIGDKVTMNNNYYVSDKNKDVVFTIKSEPFDICGTTCVLLENYRGGYALHGLTKVEQEVEGLDEYLATKRLEVLEKIKPICEAFGIVDYDYEIEGNHERLRINDTRIGCSCNSMSAIIDELVGYIFICRFNRRHLGAFKVQTFNRIREYWID